MACFISRLSLSRAVALAPALTLAACGGEETPPPEPDAGLTVETLAGGFDRPWSITFLLGGDMLVTEIGGRLLRVSADGAARTPVAGAPEPYAMGQGGLMEVRLSPDFETSGLVYLSYAAGDAAANATAVYRARLEGDALVDGETIFRATPDKDTDTHFGGRMAFLPDGTLLLTLGEGFAYREQSQINQNHLGTIVRLNPDGSAPADNPDLGPDALAEIYSYGHRNPQGVIVDPRDGSVWSNEHGPRGGDELNRIEAGANYGWPIVTEGLDYSYARVSPFSDHADQPGLTGPVFGWTPSIAPSSLELYLGDAFPDWTGDFLVTALSGKALHRVDMENGEAVGEEVLLRSLQTRLRDVRTGPDGLIYVLTDGPDGSILRLSPAR